MRILRISGKNLASLADPFCVDFESEPLASSGLFAISGPTGAGKSTLLDALCLALFDATPRLLKIQRAGAVLPDVGEEMVSALDPRTLLRRGAFEGFAEVDFVGSDEQRYRARWSLRRSRNRSTGALQPAAMSLHTLPDLTPVGSTKKDTLLEIVKRVGLSFEQFTRAILLAQNEFSAFLKTDENERGELLETLTGSTIYSSLSRRAYERYKLEQAALQQISGQLAYQKPMPDDERAALMVRADAADIVLAQVLKARQALEVQQRWQADAERLQAASAAGQSALDACQAALLAAVERSSALARIELAQAARPLQAELARIARETEQNVAKELGFAAAVQTNEATLSAAAQNEAAAQAQLTVAAAARQAAAPQLDEAKALDAAMATLAPTLEQATVDAAAAQAAADLSAANVKALNDKLNALETARASATAWQSAHKADALLAQDWPRWDLLLQQATNNAQALAAAKAACVSAQQASADAAVLQQACTAKLQQSATKLAALLASRAAAQAALAAMKPDQLRARRHAFGLWQALAAARDQASRAATALAATDAEFTQAQVMTQAARAEAPSLAAAQQQAERSLQAAEIACTANVESLRAQLKDEHACPVCGSTAHPYQHQNDTLHAMLAGLQAEVERARQAAQSNATAIAVHGAAMANAEAQLPKLTLAAQATQEQATLAEHAWQANPHSATLPSAEQLAADEAQLAQATLHYEASRNAFDAAQAAHAREQENATRADAALAAAHAAQNTAQQTQSATELAKAAQLEALDAAFPDPAWRTSLEADGPALFHQQCAAKVTAWRQHAQDLDATARAQDATRLELVNASKAATDHTSSKAATHALHARLVADMQAKQIRRTALWAGRPVSEVETSLLAQETKAHQATAAARLAHQSATQEQVRLTESLAGAARRQAELGQSAKAAQARLADWLAATHIDHPTLEALLAHTQDWIGAERQALQALHNQAANAATVLAERKAQEERHLAAKPLPEPLPSEEPVSALSLEQAQEVASGLRFQLKQDEERRHQASSLLDKIHAQESIERRWATMYDLIGSSDGKKFRNYAQQFTLDVLLGYANAHLQQLARRYRLERVLLAGVPSLGLMVRDLDMGGEVRSVNSLSGGESFLVSLALALGLASLSSNRVRVESLFIDEGFGSLDAETLRVAMDALDGLQASGRKVGVISHVQEMTERLAVRILVQPNGGGSSTVAVL